KASAKEGFMIGSLEIRVPSVGPRATRPHGGGPATGLPSLLGCLVLGALLAVTSCTSDSEEPLGAVREGLRTDYYVDPVDGTDVVAGGTSLAPWKTVSYAITRIASKPAAQQSGAILNLRGGQIYPPAVFPSTLNGSAAEPIVVQPWFGAVGGGQGITFD